MNVPLLFAGYELGEDSLNDLRVVEEAVKMVQYQNRGAIRRGSAGRREEQRAGRPTPDCVVSRLPGTRSPAQTSQLTMVQRFSLASWRIRVRPHPVRRSGPKVR